MMGKIEKRGTCYVKNWDCITSILTGKSRRCTACTRMDLLGKRLLYQVYDVTSMLLEGENVIGASCIFFMRMAAGSCY